MCLENQPRWRRLQTINILKVWLYITFLFLLNFLGNFELARKRLKEEIKKVRESLTGDDELCKVS